MQVVLTEAAMADLIGIGRDIAQDNPVRAATFVDELYESCQRLAGTPRAYPLLPKWEASGVRRRVHDNYLIFYRIRDDVIEVIHVLHGARDYERILFPGD